MAFLQAQNLPPTLALKLYRALGPAAPQIVQSDPYRLTEVRGVGFKTADRIAARAGIARDAAERLDAAAVFALDEFADQGHTYMPRELLMDAAGQTAGAAQPGGSRGG